MAKRPRSTKSDSKRTSFGKKTGAEKAFKKGRKSRSEDSDRAPRFSKSAGRSSRDDKGGSDFRAKRPSRFGSSDEKRSDKPERKSIGADKPGRPEGFTKRPSRAAGGSSFSKPERSSGFSKSSRPERDGDAPKRSYRKSEDSSFSKPGRSSFSKSGPRKDDDRPKRSFGKSDDDRPKRSFDKPDASRGEDRPKRSFDKPEGDSFSRPERPKFSKSTREGSDEKKSFRESPSFSRPDRGDKKPFKKSDDESAKPRGREDFKKTDKKFDSGSFSRPYKPTRFSKSPRKEGDEEKPERKSFVQSRKEASKYVKRSSTEEKVDDGLIRLNKYIANAGVGSRREADELIKMGLVSVNGTVITEMGHKIKPTDEVRYEDKLLKAEKLVYLLLNKPKGFITTTADPQERNTVMNLVASACKERVYPVGRLDRNTTGLLLLTNDGDLADKLTHPSYQAKKIYKVELDKPLTKNDFEKIKAGVRLEEGKAIVDEIANVSDDNMTIGIEIHIGWNRVVRRIFESLEYQVVRLDRVVYAGLDKKDLPRGEWRFLKPEEIIRLKHFK